MAYAVRRCACGHEENIHGKGVRRGQAQPASPKPCVVCAHLLAMIRGETKVAPRATPWENLPPRSEIREGREFSYEVRGHLVHFRITGVEREGGELLGVSAPAYSVGGKTERDWSRSRASFAPEYTVVRVMVDPGIMGVAPFEVAHRVNGHF